MNIQLKKLPFPYWLAILGGFLLACILTFKRLLLVRYRLSTAGLQMDAEAWQLLEKEFWVHTINFTLWGILMPLVVYVVRRYRVYVSAPTGERLMALLASLGMAFLHETVSNVMYYLPRHVFGAEAFTKAILHRIINFYPAGIIDRLIEYWILYAIFSAIEFQRKFRDKQIELAQVEGQLFGAQLNALRLQLQPHFLFNTLNTISSLMEIDIKGAQRIVSKLGSLLRGVLDKDKRNLIPLREELEFIKSYLDIEQARFNDRLSIQYNIDEETVGALVPTLVLQPLVENAIKHGFARKTGKGLIQVLTKCVDNKVVMTIKDDGAGSNHTINQLLDEGIGLKNVKERLNLLYKENYQLDIQSAPGAGFEVTITIPHQRQEG